MTASDRLRRTLIVACLAAATALFAGAAGAVGAVQGVPSAQYWAEHPEHEARIAEPASGIYQPNTDEDFIKHVLEARSLPAASTKAWRNAGPFGGIEDLAGVGSGAEAFGKVGGIGTAIAVDPSDPTGNTVYLGGHGGLYKSTDGGNTMKNITDGKLLRYSIGAVAVDPHNPNDLYVGSG